MIGASTNDIVMDKNAFSLNFNKMFPEERIFLNYLQLRQAVSEFFRHWNVSYWCYQGKYTNPFDLATHMGDLDLKFINTNYIKKYATSKDSVKYSDHQTRRRPIRIFNGGSIIFFQSILC